ncbi:MAG: 30S ribosome-binding factor RbfA [Saprospiraceae bacterium]|nr:30S ribosome-binding factor RbfA [Saprospiraceae bacterium]MBP7699680.1 30S ribosome-binding factor RbfA [Saprospiraceae bacterium]
MESVKQRQVGELIKRHLSITLQQEGTYIYGATPLVSVSEVKMSPDFSLAKIYISVYNVEDKQTVILELEVNNTRIRQLLAARIKNQVRRIPEIAFYLDDTLDEMYRVDALMKRLHDEGQMGNDDITDTTDGEYIR